MIKKTLSVAAATGLLAFAAGCYVGWKTTLRIIDTVRARYERENKGARV